MRRDDQGDARLKIKFVIMLMVLNIVKKPSLEVRQVYQDGARSRNRTGTVFPPRDFKSLASTNFAIRAYLMDGLTY